MNAVRPVWWRVVPDETDSEREPKPRKTFLRTMRDSFALVGYFAIATAAFVAVLLLMRSGVIETPATLTISPSESQGTLDPNLAHIGALSVVLECNRHGLGPGVIPARALIRLDGAIKVVSFDRGWKSYEGNAPGTLVSVCRK